MALLLCVMLWKSQRRQNTGQDKKRFWILKEKAMLFFSLFCSNFSHHSHYLIELKCSIFCALKSNIPQEKEMQKGKNLSEEALQIAEKRREAKGKGEKERYTHLNAEVQRIARRNRKAFLSDQCKKYRKTIEWERLEITSRKLEIPREHFMQRWSQ